MLKQKRNIGASLRVILAILCLQLKVCLSASLKSVLPANCPEKCGNITVPYPFGIGDNCHYGTPFDDGRYFNLSCNVSTNPPTLALGNRVTLEKITLEGDLWANYPISYRCYTNSNSNVPSSEYLAFIRTKKFPLSSTKNMIGAIGCDTYVLLNGTMKNKREFRSGCLTVCATSEDVDRRTCSGIGCCLASIPDGVNNLDLTFRSLDDQKLVQDFNPCSVAFVLAKDRATNGNVLPFSIKQILSQNDTIYKNLKFPVVFNWAIGNTTCEKARATGNYICNGNSNCVDMPYQEGYRCQCKPGFDGNPYLRDCQDINECAASSTNPCSMVCVNTPGCYKCSCPNGYIGDGFKNGTSCTKIVNNNSSLLKKITLGLSTSLGSILLLLCCFWMYSFFKKRMIIKQKAIYFERNGGLLLEKQMSYDESVVARMKIFSADELDRATDYFNKNRIVGKGGQGTVYKGMLSEGQIVAIKRSKIQSEGQILEFINEMVILSQINHRNIVKLLGCCLETEVPLLVYEFIPNGTLLHHIQQPSEEFPITWRMRLQIASDSAGALFYLHSSSATPVLHRDIKTSNILLDEKYRAKLSDFGISRSIGLDETHVTTRVMGTYGYLDPEYFRSSQFTDKSDVYSFGVVLVELLTGQKAVRKTSEEDKNLASWFLLYMENSHLLDIIDTQLLKEGSKEEFYTIANLAKRCLNMEGKFRPTMKEVLRQIEAIMSFHLPLQNWLETQQVASGATQQNSHNFSHSRTNFSDNTSTSDELSLLFSTK